MASIQHRELRNNSSDVLRRVAAGEVVTVTNHGEVAAVLIPPPHTVLDALVAAGRVREARNPRRFSLIPRVSELSSRQALDDLRGDR